jgi:type IV secretory pathway VirB10-like protein
MELMMGRMIGTVFLLCACAASAQAQDIPPREPPAADSDPALTHRPAATAPALEKPLPSETIPLIVPKGTPVQVILDEEVRVRKVGQAIHGRIAEPVYAFDKVVLPLGTEVTGEITDLEGVSWGKRTLDALDAEFTPPRKVRVEFNELITADGRHIPIRSTVTPGSGEEIQFVTAAEDQTRGPKDAVADKAKQAKEEAKREWDAAVKQAKQPGKVHRLKRVAIAQLPVHPQYLDAGTVYFAELEEPLDFGSEPMTGEIAVAIKTPAPPGSFLRARLMTAVNSMTTLKGDEVEAILSQPLFDGTRLILPQGSRLKGTVVQVQRARYLSRDGRLRMVFHELVLPDGMEQKVDAILEGIQAGKDQNLRMDSEGGAEATPPKTRFLATSVSVGLGAISFLGDTFGDTGPRVAGGAGGYKLVGIALGAAIHSQGFGMAMGAYGGCRSIYTHFIARGRDVVFPRNTSLVIGIGARTEPPPKPPEAAPAVELRPPA